MARTNTISGRVEEFSMKVNRRRVLIIIVRIAQALLSIGVLILFSILARVDPAQEWWFWTAATTMLTTAIAEPYYTGTISALLYGFGGVAAGITAQHSNVLALWVVYYALAGSVIVSAIVSMLIKEGPVNRAAYWVAKKFGRPIWLGLSAVAIELLRGAGERGIVATGMLGAGVLIATVISIPDWYSILISVSPNDEVQTVVENAIDPNVLLVSADQRMLPGRLIKVVGEKGTVKGVVVANLAHKTGTRTQVALQAPWTDVVGASGAPVRIVRCADEHDPVLGLVSEGSTDRQLDLRSFGSLSRGDTVYWKNPEGVLNLYQISRLELRQSVWDGATVISEHSTAIALGTIEKDEIEPDYQLPLPLEPVFGAEKISIQLSDSFVRIGNIASTQVPVGVSVKSLRGQHTAILGMSGMGKSTIARRLMDILTNDGTVVALDGTGEYKSRFAMSEWKSQSPLPIGGKWVYQPIGVQSDAAMNFIKQVMGIAAGEYKRGTPSSRTILLEEAHSFLPEWNFAISRDETNTVSDSCRCILQARKFNINFIFVSQRTAVISKSALSQCESYIIFRTLDDTSLQYIEGVVGAGFRDIVSSLKRFQAVCVGPAFSTSIPVVVDLDPYSEPSSEAEYIPEGNIQDQK